jgi:hypothetical protein
MKNKPQHGFAKKPLVIGVATALSISMLTSVVNIAQAARWDLGDVQISFDSTFSLGSSWAQRIEIGMIILVSQIMLIAVSILVTTEFLRQTQLKKMYGLVLVVTQPMVMPVI